MAWRPMLSALLPAIVACATLASASCGDDGGIIEHTDAVTGASGSSTPDGYPVGPYGADVGETLPNLEWMGFRSEVPGTLATAAPYEAYSLDDARLSGKRYALLHFGAVF